MGELNERLERPTRWKGKRVRALHRFGAPDSTLLEAISCGERAVRGFRNRDLQLILFGPPAPLLEEKRRGSARMSRQLRLLRAHHLIHRVAREHRYHLTKFGRQVITAVLAARRAIVT